ncbi:MAG: glycosyltransferase family 2 protein [Bacteroidales bacterium]|nr:glycosyltransferase family 2 protein [Bacteroidales bacterium]
MKPKLCIVVPCYNEEEALAITSKTLLELLGNLILKNKIDESSILCFVDDGSRDATWEIIKDLSQKNKNIHGIKFSTNFGHQNALLAGLLNTKDKSDCIVTIDADLQDDANVIEEMLDKFNEGNEIVYGVRNNRSSDSIFKRFTAQFFYKLMSAMKVKTVYNHADYRLASKRVLNEFARFNEVNLFLRGIFPSLGFKSANVYYKRSERVAGETKYPLKKMIEFAWNGITSFSIYPLRLIFFLGLIIFFLSFLLIIWAFLPVFQGEAVRGWASTVIPLFFFGGLQMICLGIIGEYAGKIYKEIKARPRFIIEEEI